MKNTSDEQETFFSHPLSADTTIIHILRMLGIRKRYSNKATPRYYMMVISHHLRDDYEYLQFKPWMDKLREQ